MRILIAYPGPTHSTYDVAAGYEKALRATGHTVTAFNYHQYIEFYNRAVEYWHDHSGYSAVDAVTELASRQLVIAAIDFVPHVVLIIAGGLLHRSAHQRLYNLDIPMALMLTESPYLDQFQSQILEKGHIAVAFTNELYSVDKLAEQTGVKTIYLPHSYDPDVHKPIDINGGHKSDVFFHGTLWPERKALLDGIADLSLDIRLSGYEIDEKVTDKHIISNIEMAMLYNGAAICLNHHRTFTDGVNGPIEKAYSIGPRAYEIAACEGFQLCDGTRPELIFTFGESVPTYKDARDLRKKIEHFIRRPDDRRELAELSRLRAQECTFANRVEGIVLPALQEVL